MSRNEKQVEDFLRRTKFDDSPNYKHRDELEQRLVATLADSPRRENSRWNLRRIVIETKTHKRLVAAVVLIAVFVGMGQISTGRVMFAKVTETAKTGLARLKEFLEKESLRIQESPKPLPPRPAGTTTMPGEDIQGVPTVMIVVQVFTANIKSNKKLAGFLDTQAIQFVQAQSDPNLVYPTPSFWAKLSAEKTEAFLQYTKSHSDLRRIVSPRLLVRSGQEAFIATGTWASRSFEGQAIAIVPTIHGEDGRIDLNFSFIYAEVIQQGFEIRNVQMGADETLLVRTAVQSPKSRSLMARIFGKREETLFVLLEVKIVPPKDPNNGSPVPNATK